MRASISEGEYITGALPRQNRLSKLQHDRSPDPQNICVKTEPSGLELSESRKSTLNSSPIFLLFEF